MVQVVRLAHNHAFTAQANEGPLRRVPKRDVRDLLREADSQADVRAKDRVA